MLSHGVKRVLAQNGARALRTTTMSSGVSMVNHRNFSGNNKQQAGNNNMMMFLGLSALAGAGAVMTKMNNTADAEGRHYTTKSTQALPAWIQCGLGDTPFYCPEKNATYGGPYGDTPDQMPDISKHANFMTDFLKKNPEVYD